MDIEKLFELADAGSYDELMDALEAMPPRMLMRFAESFEKKGKNIFEDLIDDFTEAQKERMHWLGSSEREREYLMSIPDEEMTDEDWFDLRATDF